MGSVRVRGPACAPAWEPLLLPPPQAASAIASDETVPMMVIGLMNLANIRRLLWPQAAERPIVVRPRNGSTPNVRRAGAAVNGPLEPRWGVRSDWLGLERTTRRSRTCV